MPGIPNFTVEAADVKTTKVETFIKTETTQRVEAIRRVVLIFGPTAVGKTELLLAPVFHNSEIINADSMQVYRGMNIGTAKPEAEFLAKVRHHLIDVRDPSEQFHAGDFVEAADRLVSDIHGRGKLPVICGGTGFYFKNFIYGLPDAPPSNEAVRKRLQAEFEKDGAEKLIKRLSQADPVSAERINPNDHYRIMRALEVFESSGKPLSDFKIPTEPRPGYETLLIGLIRDRKELYERINHRVNIMFEQGLEAEVAALREGGFCEKDPGMKGIGYREFFIAEREGLDEAQLRELIRRNSRRYAKRQITWFKQLKSVNWFDPEDISGISECVNSFIGSIS